jgi:diadenosine tetraphosphate (Ap4A) HIT family hydrolase
MPQNYDSNNVFARILRGELPSTRVYEDEHCVVILDIAPVNKGHLLVIPKTAAQFVAELDEALAAHLFTIGVRVSKALRDTAPRCEDINFWIADGAAAGQEVPHVHLHVIPRFAGDGFGWKSGPNNRQMQTPEALKAVADPLRAALEKA